MGNGDGSVGTTFYQDAKKFGGYALAGLATAGLTGLAAAALALVTHRAVKATGALKATENLAFAGNAEKAAAAAAELNPAEKEKFTKILQALKDNNGRLTPEAQKLANQLNASKEGKEALASIYKHGAVRQAATAVSAPFRPGLKRSGRSYNSSASWT